MVNWVVENINRMGGEKERKGEWRRQEFLIVASGGKKVGVENEVSQ